MFNKQRRCGKRGKENKETKQVMPRPSLGISHSPRQKLAQLPQAQQDLGNANTIPVLPTLLGPQLESPAL